MKRLFSRIWLLFTHGPELDEVVRKEKYEKDLKEMERRRHYLDLCELHQQDSPGTIYSSHNCHYCKLLKELETKKNQETSHEN